jgi:hypothetical protein
MGSRFYLGTAFLVSIALWKFRRPGTSPTLWVVLFLLSGGLGVVGSIGIQAAQEILDREVIQFMMKRMQQNLDPYKTSTAIGKLGELKLYGRIVFRVEQLKGNDEQFLLAQNGYTVYRSPSWFSPRAGFRPVYPEPGGIDWQIGPETNTRQVLKVTSSFENGTGFLPLPLNTSFVGSLPADSLLKNPQGGLLVQNAPAWAQYLIKAGDENFLTGPPTEGDFSIPPQMMKILQPTLAKLKLNQIAPTMIPKFLSDFFETEFTYALKGTGAPEGINPLDNFLNRSHAGHCEYFATATTLLLRAAGIPARYMVGYSVHERDPVSDQFIVRLRNAHSWTLAWIGGQWVEVETTPSAWIAIENEQASSLEWVGDLLGHLKMIFVEWRWFQEEGERENGYWPLVLVSFLIYIGWNVTRRLRFSRGGQTTAANKARPFKTIRTPFSKIEDFLEDKSGPRRPDETYRSWLERLSAEEGSDQLQKDLEPILSQHYRMRFDPAFYSTTEEARLNEEVDDWLCKQEVMS